MLPAFRSEFFGVRTEEVGAAVHGPKGPLDHLARGDEKRGFMVRSTAEGQDSVTGGNSGVACHYGVEA